MAFKKGSTLYEAPPREFIQCAMIGCTYEALARVGGSNYCRDHYAALGNAQAKIHAEKHGLKTVDDHRNYIRKLLSAPKPHPRAWMENPKSEIAARWAAEVRQQEGRVSKKAAREPGEDDEPALGIPLDDFERELLDRAQP